MRRILFETGVSSRASRMPIPMGPPIFHQGAHPGALVLPVKKAASMISESKMWSYLNHIMYNRKNINRLGILVCRKMKAFHHAYYQAAHGL